MRKTGTQETASHTSSFLLSCFPNSLSSDASELRQSLGLSRAARRAGDSRDSFSPARIAARHHQHAFFAGATRADQRAGTAHRAAAQLDPTLAATARRAAARMATRPAALAPQRLDAEHRR